jgi:hypothetical protein
MSEYLYLTAILLAFSAYVVFETLKALCEQNRIQCRRAEAEPAPSEAAAPAPESASPGVAETVAAPSAAPSAPTPTVPTPSPPKSAQERGTHLRDPASGEVTPVPTNYRFAKKWIKEALVAEGLLDRIYKPGELDEAASRRVKEAIERLCLLDKYRPR